MDNINQINTQPDEAAQIEYEKNIISACIGREADGTPRCAVTSMLMIYHPEEENPDDRYEMVSSYSYLYPDFNLEIHGQFAQADIHFPENNEKGEQELVMLWRQLEEYGQLSGELKGNSSKMASMMFCVMPGNPGYEGTYLTFANPVYRTLSPVSPKGNVSTVRLLALADSFTINTLPESINVEMEYANFSRMQAVREQEEKY